jgi:hypothetical protein
MAMLYILCRIHMYDDVQIYSFGGQLYLRSYLANCILRCGAYENRYYNIRNSKLSASTPFKW